MAFDAQAAKSAGYSDGEIADYLGQQSKFDVAGARKSGYSDAEIVGHLSQGPPKPKPNTATDVVKSGLTGVGESAAQLGDAMLDAGPLGMLKRAAGATDALRGKATLSAPPQGVNPLASRVAENAHQPQTTAGEYARTIGQMAPNAFSPGSLAARAVNVFAPGITSEASGQAARAMGAGPKAEAAARIIGGVAGAGVASVRANPTVAAPKAPSMSLDQLKSATKQAYQAADDAGVAYTPKATNTLIDNVTADLKAVNLNPVRHPKAASMLADIQAMKGQSPTLTQLDQLRQVVRRDVASASDKAEQFMGRRMVGQIDQFINGAGAGDVVSGSAADASALINNARDLNTRLNKVQTINTAVTKAERRAGSTGSGGNQDNAIRQNLRGVLDKATNLSADESAALESIVMGGKGQNLLRQIGKLSPQGNGLMLAGQLAALVPTGGLSAGAAVAGAVSKLAADKMTLSKVQGLVRMISQGGTKAAEKAPQKPPLRISQNPFSAAYALPGVAAISATPAMASDRPRQR